MKSEYENFLNQLQSKIQALNEFDDVYIGVKPPIDRDYIAIIVPDEIRAEHSSPKHVVWHFLVSIYIFKRGSDYLGALGGADKIIKAIEDDLSVNNSVDTVTYNTISIDAMEDRSAAAISLIGRKRVLEM